MGRSIADLQNHRMFGVGRDLCGSSSPIPLLKQGSPTAGCTGPCPGGWSGTGCKVWPCSPECVIIFFPISAVHDSIYNAQSKSTASGPANKHFRPESPVLQWELSDHCTQTGIGNALSCYRCWAVDDPSHMFFWKLNTLCLPLTLNHTTIWIFKSERYVFLWAGKEGCLTVSSCRVALGESSWTSVWSSSLF